MEKKLKAQAKREKREERKKRANEPASPDPITPEGIPETDSDSVDSNSPAE